jgi:hypothetical protein
VLDNLTKVSAVALSGALAAAIFCMTGIFVRLDVSPGTVVLTPLDYTNLAIQCCYGGLLYLSIWMGVALFASSISKDHAKRVQTYKFGLALSLVIIAASFLSCIMTYRYILLEITVGCIVLIIFILALVAIFCFHQCEKSERKSKYNLLYFFAISLAFFNSVFFYGYSLAEYRIKNVRTHYHVFLKQDLKLVTGDIFLLFRFEKSVITSINGKITVIPNENIAIIQKD